MSSKINPDGSVEMTLRWYPQPVTRLVVDEEKVAKLEIDELEAIAKAAQESDPVWLPVRRDIDYVSFGPGIELKDNHEGPEESYLHIATFSPDVVLGLIARLREAEERIESLENTAIEDSERD